MLTVVTIQTVVKTTENQRVQFLVRVVGALVLAQQEMSPESCMAVTDQAESTNIQPCGRHSLCRVCEPKIEKINETVMWKKAEIHNED